MSSIFPRRARTRSQLRCRFAVRHQVVGNENGTLHRKPLLWLARSIRVTYLLHQIEGVFVQDCDVCCAPIAVRLRIGVDGNFEVSYDRG